MLDTVYYNISYNLQATTYIQLIRYCVVQRVALAAGLDRRDSYTYSINVRPRRESVPLTSRLRYTSSSARQQRVRITLYSIQRL